MEVHPEPDRALCDGPNMIRLDRMRDFLKRIRALHNLISAQEDENRGVAE
jgi:2-dehydro-3-deoxyphosphooctonate aldolase (KDO 8-P synthase)